MMLSNITSAIYNHTNYPMFNEELIRSFYAFIELLEKLELAKKITYIFLTIFTTLGSTLVLLATWREKSLHQPNKYFIACLAVADLLVGVLLLPISLYRLSVGLNVIFISLCRFTIWIDTFALTASIYSLVFISFDRYLKISKPLQYNSIMTTSKSLKIIFTIWLISTAFATYSVTPHSGSWGILTRPGNKCHNTDKATEYYTFLAVFALFLPVLIILVMYILIFVVVRKRQKMLRNGELGQTCNDQIQRSAFRQDLKVIQMLLVVVGVFVLCWGPYFIFLLLKYYDRDVIFPPNLTSFASLRLSFIARFIVDILPFFNSLCNPVIYTCMDQKYREAFKNLFKRMMCQTSARKRRP